VVISPTTGDALPKSPGDCIALVRINAAAFIERCRNAFVNSAFLVELGVLRRVSATLNWVRLQCYKLPPGSGKEGKCESSVVVD
jgi:hypothetical protein